MRGRAVLGGQGLRPERAAEERVNLTRRNAFRRSGAAGRVSVGNDRM